ncbi:MAG: ABC transporter permease [Myxococcaceae bacterium]|nr:ABC transporter permease [Myxococcaceae bacterium]
MNDAFGILLKKELTDALRDKKTLLVMIVVPILLYPLLMTVIGVAMSLGKSRLEREPLVVAVTSDDARALLETEPVPPFTTYARLDGAQAVQRLRERKVAAVVEAPQGAAQVSTQGGQALVTVRYTKRFDASLEGLERVRRVLKTLEEKALKTRLAKAELPRDFAEPLKTEALDVDFQEDLGPFIASRLLPLVLVLMLFMGSLYPAIDVIAGERERGTLETLLVAPVNPQTVMFAKYFTVVVVSSAAALANIAVMGLTFGIGFRLDASVSAKLTFTAAQMGVMFACLIPAAFAVSAVSMGVASLAKSFKEAQSMLTPVSTLASLPGIVALMPGVELNTTTAAIPLVNVALLIKAVVLNTARPLDVAICIASVAVLAVLAMRVLSKVFAHESLRLTGASGFGEALRTLRQR